MQQSRREFVRTLFVASQVLVAGRYFTGTALGSLAADQGSQNGLKFLVFGDWGRNGEQDQSEVAAQMAKTATQIGAKFVISVGDNFYEDGVTSTTDEQWQTSFESVYRDASLQIPWHVILGNHDYHGKPQAQLDYSKSSLRWKMPARYFAQSHQLDHQVSADFFYIDTSPMLHSYYKNPKMAPQIRTQDVPKQLAWFASALEASKARWKIVFGHHPIYSGGEHGDTQELIDHILPLLHQYNVHAYFNGHDHDLQHLTAGEVNLFCTGAGSKIRIPKDTPHTKFALGVPGFTAVDLSAERLAIRMINHDGKEIYSTMVS